MPELCREHGISLPTFYLWIQVFQGKRLLTQGAARIAAIEQSCWRRRSRFARPGLFGFPCTARRHHGFPRVSIDIAAVCFRAPHTNALAGWTVPAPLPCTR